MEVKICGIFSEETLVELVKVSEWPDYLGFVFAKSRRRVHPEQVRKWMKHLPQSVQTVGVFVNPSIEDIAETVDIIDIIQLHGEETPDFCQNVQESLGKKVWKVISVQGSAYNVDFHEYMPVVDGFIFDTAGANRGGNGRKFAWQEHQDVWRGITKPVFVAGGIMLADIANLRKYPITGIDTSSGVEIEGVKSPKKILEIIREVRRWTI